MVPLGRRLTFFTGSGLDGSGSKSKEFLAHMPDRSGMEAVSAAIADEPNIEHERTAVASCRLGKARIAILTTDPLIQRPRTGRYVADARPAEVVPSPAMPPPRPAPR